MINTVLLFISSSIDFKSAKSTRLFYIKDDLSVKEHLELHSDPSEESDSEVSLYQSAFDAVINSAMIWSMIGDDTTIKVCAPQNWQRKYILDTYPELNIIFVDKEEVTIVNKLKPYLSDLL